MPDFDTQINSDAFEDSPLATVYYNVLNELTGKEKGRGRIGQRRVALWVAWESHRVANITNEDFANANAHKVDLLTMVGLPKTQKAFAELIGVSPRTLRNYAKKHGHFVSLAQEMGVQRVLSRYDLPALHALGLSASTPDSRHSSDRRIFFTMRGHLVDKQDITSDGEKLEVVVRYADKRDSAAETS